MSDKMTREQAFWILRNLMQRSSNETSSPLTRIELDALAILLDDSNSKSVAENTSALVGTERLYLAEKEDSIALSLDGFSESANSDSLMCLDFGTSFSKAYVVRDDGLVPELIDIELGSSTEGRSRYFMEAEMLIDQGSVYFGIDAIKRVADRDSERLIESPKQLFTLEPDVASLRYRKLGESKDPDQMFSVRDIIVLYLAFLNQRAEASAVEHGVDRNVCRRFSHPAWDTEYGGNNQAEMGEMFAEAIVISRTLDGRFDNLKVELAQRILKEARALDRALLPTALVKGSVREATAAGAGALLDTETGRQKAYIVIDVGAGTTDIAGFLARRHAMTDVLKLWEVTGSAIAIRSAGNKLDLHLTSFVKERLKYDSGGSEEYAIDHFLRVHRRRFKEELFNEGKTSIRFTTEDEVSVDLSEFLEYPPVKKFRETLRGAVAKSIDALGPEFCKDAVLVATGGGAHLPMIQELGSERLQTESCGSVQLAIIEPMSEGLRQTNPEIIPVYSQLAVAIGGALPELPEEKPLDKIPGPNPGKTVLQPMYKN